MKFRHFVLILFTLTLFFCLSACSGGKCTEHKDGNADGVCDTAGCNARVEGDAPAQKLVLIENNEAKFQFVIADDAATGEIISIVNTLSKGLKAHGILADWAFENDEEIECEILIGSVHTRGDENFCDAHALGPGGYIIKLSDSKLIVNGGSLSSLIKVLGILKDDIFGLSDGTKPLENLIFSADMNVRCDNSDYTVDSISISGNPLEDYVIYVESGNKYQKEGALQLQNMLYSNAGYWLNIVSELPEDKKAIIFKTTERDDTSHDSFKVYVDGASMLIEAEYENAFLRELDEFGIRTVFLGSGDLNFAGEVYEKDVSIVYYTDFGASADGYFDNFKQIKEAHDYANISGQLVKAIKPGEKDLIFRLVETTKDHLYPQTIKIMTNVDWTGAKFIIDDELLAEYDDTDMYSVPIFEVISPYNSIKVKVDEGIVKGTSKLNLNLSYPAYVIITDESIKTSIKYGNSESYSPAQEIILVDDKGYVDSTTPILLDYTNECTLSVFRMDLDPLIIDGGIFTRYASRKNIISEGEIYTDTFKRGIQITRPNTTIKNFEYYIEGEFTTEEQKKGKNGPAYSGFVEILNTTNVVVENCILTAPRYYRSGSFATSVTLSNNVVYRNCTQSNFYKKDANGNLSTTLSTEKSSVTKKQEYWGPTDANYCKNLIYDGCLFTRIDTHRGVYNAKLTNSKVAAINILGGGELIIENTEIILSREYIIDMRADYGATWCGTVKIKDCTLSCGSNNYTKLALFRQNWYNYNFGYSSHLPSVTIDNIAFSIDDEPVPIYIYGSNDAIYKDTGVAKSKLSTGKNNKNTITPPEYIRVERNYYGIEFYVYNAPFIYETELVGVVKVKK